MTPAIAPDVVVEYHLRCSCGAFILSTEKTVTCAYCGQFLGIRRVKRHRRRWTTVAPGSARKGWRWRKHVVESVAERTFHVHCGCGSTIAISGKTAICPDCGEAIGVRRVRHSTRSKVAVEYGFTCCFCGTPIVTSEKTPECPSCNKTLKIVRVGTHGQYWKAIPLMGVQDGTSKNEEQTDSVMPWVLVEVSLFLVCLGQSLYEFAIR